ncbi:hypothetical protein ARMSODRAFT_982989 [Armillaria solidipes]|uniref:Uncharacterized protein n=1 Tax=Armillaria solidipes TaxID=1076256 RepID=A0A2H3APB3_9AGAR|nr:hypothetical protein ARMSODRAFT_982989 [Armillaria solidipes]
MPRNADSHVTLQANKSRSPDFNYNPCLLVTTFRVRNPQARRGSAAPGVGSAVFLQTIGALGSTGYHLTITSISLHCIGPWRGVLMPEETLVKGVLVLVVLDTFSGLKSSAGWHPFHGFMILFEGYRSRGQEPPLSLTSVTRKLRCQHGGRKPRGNFWGKWDVPIVRWLRLLLSRLTRFEDNLLICDIRFGREKCVITRGFGEWDRCPLLHCVLVSLDVKIPGPTSRKVGSKGIAAIKNSTRKCWTVGGGVPDSLQRKERQQLQRLVANPIEVDIIVSSTGNGRPLLQSAQSIGTPVFRVLCTQVVCAFFDHGTLDIQPQHFGRALCAEMTHRFQQARRLRAKPYAEWDEYLSSPDNIFSPLKSQQESLY